MQEKEQGPLLRMNYLKAVRGKTQFDFTFEINGKCICSALIRTSVVASQQT